MTLAWEIDGFLESKGGRLAMDGVDVSELAREHGTPLFIFSKRRIATNIDRIRRCFDEQPLRICYASKANSVTGILKAVKDSGADIEVNSGGELFKALHAGFRPSQIVFNGTSKTEREISEAVSAGIYAIQADSIFEIERIEKVASSLKRRAKVSLRLVPEISTDTLHGLQTALLTSKFGMMRAEAVEAFSQWPEDHPAIDLCGLHLHIGSQTPDPEPYSEAFQVLYSQLKDIHRATGRKVRHINVGGGFPVNYLRDDSGTDSLNESQKRLFRSVFDPSEALANGWAAVCASARAEGLEELVEDLELLVEPGRSVIADAGVCLATIENKKHRPLGGDTDTWLLTDAGFNILLSMETYKWYYELVAAERLSALHGTRYRMAGPLCDGGDVYFDIEGKGRLPDHRLLPEGMRPGDLIALLNCGAYSVAQMFPYNGRQLPAVVLVGEDGAARIIRERDSYEDLLMNEV
jgi:diaminopimelate decarboxylase